MKVVINAGGKGTRINSLHPNIPKPMIKINNKPILEYQINQLKKYGFKDIIIITGHLGNIIEDYFEDGKEFGVNIFYHRESSPLGTAGALLELREILKEDFLFIFADIIFDLDLNKFIDFHFNKKADITLFSHPNDHPFDSTILKTDTNSKIIEIMPKEINRKHYRNIVNAGLHIISPKILNPYVNNTKLDLDRDILFNSVNKYNLFAYVSSEYVKDAGTQERFFEVEQDISSGKVKARNIQNKQKAIFIDRDGTINIYKEHLCSTEDFELINGVIEAIKRINKSEYLAIIITNQPVLAKGLCSKNELQDIHNKMETMLGKERAYLDAIYYCPHHPEKGFKGEIKELKIECTCRKPKPGLLLKAAEDFNIDLSQSYMVGDSIIDIEAGLKAGCTPVLICNNLQKDKNVKSFNNLLEFTASILKS